MAGTAQKAWLGAATALPSLSGVLVVRKPNGTTSAAVLNRLREKLLAAGIPHPTRRSRNKILKIGHGGTLDKNASGVLGGQELEQRWKFTSCSTQTADLPTFQSSSSAS